MSKSSIGSPGFSDRVGPHQHPYGMGKYGKRQSITFLGNRHERDTFFQFQMNMRLLGSFSVRSPSKQVDLTHYLAMNGRFHKARLWHSEAYFPIFALDTTGSKL